MNAATSQAYANFRAWVPRNVIPVGTQNPQEWVYYDWGPRSYPEPLVCLHSIPGSADMFFAQVTALAPRGYRILSLEIAEYWTTASFCDAFHTFLEIIGVSRIHLYGVGLGGFLAMNYVSRKPERVASLLLTHAWFNTDGLSLGVRYPSSVLRWLPDFLIRATVRDMLPKEMDSVSEFVARVSSSAPRSHLAARLALISAKGSVTVLDKFPEDRITLIDSIERTREKDLDASLTIAKHLAGAKQAMLKSGGDFPFISVSDEVNLHIIVHLRRNAPAPTEFPTIPPPALLPRMWRHEELSPSSKSGTDSEPDDAESQTEEETIGDEGNSGV